MNIVLKGKNTEYKLSGHQKVSQILKALDINPETVLVIKDGEILTRDHIVKDSDEIEIISVVSGG